MPQDDSTSDEGAGVAIALQGRMELDANSLLASLLIGSIGFVALVYGKRQGRVPHMVVGLALMVYPYFVPNVLVMMGIAVALLAALWLGVRSGL